MPASQADLPEKIAWRQVTDVIEASVVFALSSNDAGLDDHERWQHFTLSCDDVALAISAHRNRCLKTLLLVLR